MTLVEILMISGLLVLILSQVISLGTEGQYIMDESSKMIQLQNGIRAVLENMVQDVNAAVAFVSPQNQQMTVARYKGPVDDDLFALNLSTSNITFPYYLEGGATVVKHPVLFVEYQVSNPDNTNQNSLVGGTEGRVSRVAKEGVLEAFDSPEGMPYFIDQYNVNLEALTLVAKRVLAEKVSKFQMEYYGYNDQTGQLMSAGEVGTDAGSNALIAMVHVHIAAEDPYERETRRTPTMEIATKIWSYRHIMENKYPEYFGHLDRDLRF